MRRIFSLVFAGLLLLGASGRAEVYEAPDPEPTPEEVLLVEFINLCRTDPAAATEHIVPGGWPLQGWVPDNVDWEMFKKEMKEVKPAPPLAINLQLLNCARKHSFYMIQNGLEHDEESGKRGFVAKDFSQRIRKAGYDWRQCGENIFRDADSPWQSQAGFMIDWGKGPGGMLPKRGHRANIMNRGFREAGCACLPHEERFSVTQDFADRDAPPRLAGGVVYIDKKNKNFYDVGEGVGGVTLTASDGSTTVTWKSGGYALELKSNQAVTLTASLHDQTFSKNFPAGGENIKFDWIMPEKTPQEKK